MKDLVIYKENSIDISDKTSYYKKIGVTDILIDPFSTINEEVLENIFSLRRALYDKDLGLIITIDIFKILNLLIETEENIEWKLPKIRNSLYQFINYLIKHDISGFYFKNLDFILEANYSYIRELSKNTLNNEVLAIAEISTSNLGVLHFLSSKSYNNFSYVYNIASDKEDFLSLKDDLDKVYNEDNDLNVNYLLNVDNVFKIYTNSKNFPYYSHTLLAGFSYFLKGAILLKNFEEIGIFSNPNSRNEYNLLKESNDNFVFYQKILSIRSKSPAIIEGKFRQIFTRDSDVLAYIRTYEDEKIVVFANFSQKEVMIDIRFHFIDLHDFKYLLGNYGRRRIVKNLLLRPYEFVSFKK
ncbi:alpha-glucosidase C-terminal domain-containing protein [uncultured Anaerococcus sp.]|uniref:alpha-glucosidase C-terminal domain-containing protein n=1 Tax=uncultured Anaerococcus sp. TaxID=293428 RepID=UPI002623B822|nr:alpha-glucosidase C-terminal domain-containing protein [uncultured Anaerococcus sp.]